MKNYILYLLVPLTLLISCEKEEPEPVSNDNDQIINPPLPSVDLSCHFSGVINGVSIELTQNVNGFTCIPSSDETILTAPDFSYVSYYANMSSAQTDLSIKIGLGRLFWDAGVVSNPTVSSFNTFFNNNLTPDFSDSAMGGFEVTYRDPAGTLWVSHENSTNLQNVTFTNLIQESDTNGDYNKFDCTFNCYVYHQDESTLLWDSLKVESAEFKAWFKW